MIFCVEDEANIRELVVYTLETTGFEARGFEEGTSFFEALAEELPELILLDIMLPGEDGMEILKKLKTSGRTKDIPVIMVTAKGAEYDKVMGLDAGADDYVTKPFSMKILLKKIRVMLKLVSEEADSVFDDGYLKVDLSKAKVEVNGKPCSLTPTEFKLLQVFLEHKRQLLTYNILLERLWDCDGQFVDKHTLVVNVNRLRGKIEDMQHKYISNVYGMGYQWLDLS